MSMGGRGSWTEERLATLIKRWADGDSAGAISKVLKISRSAVAGKVHRLRESGVPMRSAPGGGMTKGEREAAESVWIKPLRAKKAAEPRVVRPPPPPIVDKPAPAGVIGILELTADTCRYPLGDPRAEPFGFCGKQAVLTPAMIKSGRNPLPIYCREHNAIAFIPDRGRRRA